LNARHHRMQSHNYSIESFRNLRTSTLMEREGETAGVPCTDNKIGTGTETTRSCEGQRKEPWSPHAPFATEMRCAGVAWPRPSDVRALYTSTTLHLTHQSSLVRCLPGAFCEAPVRYVVQNRRLLRCLVLRRRTRSRSPSPPWSEELRVVFSDPQPTHE
jgi:hypothetical protein